MSGKGEQRTVPVDKIGTYEDLVMSGYTPFNDGVVVFAKRNDRTAGGILIPESAQETEAVLTVIGVGPKCENVQVGDRVVIAPGVQPRGFEVGGKFFLQFEEWMIMGRIDMVTHKIAIPEETLVN